MNYTSFLKSPAKDKWEKIGIQRRSGIAVPLFSIYSKSSTWIGDFSDLRLVIDWCKECGFSILQLLPLFDTGYDFAPYSSVSSFALDLMYLNIQELIGVDMKHFSNEINNLKKSFPNNKKYTDYAVKKAKEDLLFNIFKSLDSFSNNYLEQFKKNNKYWLYDYAYFKVLSEIKNTPAWEYWYENEKNYDKIFLESLEIEHTKLFNFHLWVQWQLYEQLRKIKNYAQENNVLLMGDIPFLVSRNSADVWAHQNYFKLELSAGAPPDMFFAYGQKWGTPPYNWKNVATDKYIYLYEKLKYAENFFDMYRLDHFVGLFRIWVVENNFSLEKGAVNGRFDPENDDTWEKHGKKIIQQMLNASSMLPCAEDLGTVPECSYSALKEFSIPGIDFQRFKKENYNFINTKKYRDNSISIISTHDLSFFINWWDFEAGSIDKTLFNLLCKRHFIKQGKIKIIKDKLFDKNKSKYDRLYWKENVSLKDIHSLFKREKEAEGKIKKLFLDSYKEKEKFLKFLKFKNNKNINKTDLVFKCLEQINDSSSIFSIQLLQDYLCLDAKLIKKINKRNYRINIPGTCSKKNWSTKLPIPLEKLKELKINETIRKLNRNSERIS